jgi:hypothetical protein
MNTLEYIVNGSAFCCNYADRSAIECVLKVREIDEELPYTAIEGDPDALCAYVYSRLIAGDAGPISDFSPELSSTESDDPERLDVIGQIQLVEAGFSDAGQTLHELLSKINSISQGSDGQDD